jgi:uncharacterized protein (TIGR00730 family)
VNSVCIFCGSSPGASPAYREAAARMGRVIARSGRRLVYGGARVGLMGTVADAALAEGGTVVGVMPQHMIDREVAHTGLTELHVVGTMHERKALMADLSDAFVALPGGLGTMEELFEVWTWGQLGLHRKPYGVLDVAGFYAPLLAFLDHAVAERFVRAEHRAFLVSDDDPERLLARMAEQVPPAVVKWIDRSTT